MIPGSNLLNQAMLLVAKQQFTYYRFLSREANAIGVYESVYEPAVTGYGSLQAVPRNLYQQMGLDFQKKYLTLYVAEDLIGVERDTSGDYIRYANDWWQIESDTDWLAADGWRAFLCARVADAPDISGPYYD